MSVLPLLERLRRQCTGAVLGTALAMAALPGVSEVATFTDSRGRTTLFEYSLKDEWDPMAPRGVLLYFHGHAIGSQEDMLRWYFPRTRSLAYAHDLIPVTVASPESNARSDAGGLDHLEWYKAAAHTGPGRRNWTEEDERLIQELLQSHFGGRLRVDFDRVVFFGALPGDLLPERFRAALRAGLRRRVPGQVRVYRRGQIRSGGLPPPPGSRSGCS